MRIYFILEVPQRRDYPTFKMHNIRTAPLFTMHNIGTSQNYSLCLELEFGLYLKNKLPLVALVFFYLNHLGQILSVCLPLFNQVSIVWIRNALFKICILKTLFLVLKFLQGCGPCYSFNFCRQSTIF